MAGFSSARSARTSSSALRVRQQRPDRQRDQVARLLQPARQHQLGVRDDLVAASCGRRRRRAASPTAPSRRARAPAGRGSPRSPRPARALAVSADACFSGSPSKLARPTIMPAFQRLRSSHGTSSSPSMKRSDRIDIGSASSGTGRPRPAPRTRRSARARAGGSCRRCAPRPRAGGTAPRRPADAFLVRALRAEHVLAHRAVERRGVGLGREHLGRLVDVLHVLEPRHQPQLDRGDPRDGLVVAQARVDRDRGRSRGRPG